MSFASQVDSWGDPEQGKAKGGYNPFGGPSAPTSYQKSGPYSDDHDVEYQRSYQLVADNVKQMTSEFNTISKMAQAIGTSKDSGRFREQVNAKLSATNNLVRDTQNAIKAMAQSVQQSTSASKKERKMKVDKLGQDFEKFNDKYKQLASITKSKMEESPLSSSQQSKGASNPFSFDTYTDQDEENDKLNAKQRKQDLVQLDDEREFQDALIQERDTQIRVIQGQMIEVNDIFKDLARLVEEQGEMVDNIQTNISTAATHVDTGVEEIKKANEYQQSSRKKLIFIAILIVVVVGIAVTVIVITTRPKN